MKRMYTLAIATSTAIATIAFAPPASAQLGGVLGGGAGAQGAGGAGAVGGAAAQVQQRIQANVQQRAQVQIQARLQNQAQARIQAEAARAAKIALRVSNTAVGKANEAQQRARQGISVNGKASITGNAGLQAGNTSANAHSHTQLGVHAHAAAPTISEADLQVYDSIFGQFNPLREKRAPATETPQAEPTSTAGEQPQPTTTASEAPAANESQTARTDESAESGLTSHLDLAVRMAIATRQRRAEISSLRDKAITTGSVQLLTQADAMEQRLDAFAQAQARLQTQAGVAANQAATTATEQIARSEAEMRQQAEAKQRATLRYGTQLQADVNATADAQAQFGSQAAADAAAAAKAAAKSATANPVRIGANAEGSANGSAKTKTTRR